VEAGDGLVYATYMRLHGSDRTSAGDDHDAFISVALGSLCLREVVFAF
jgi:hypothetical protein